MREEEIIQKAKGLAGRFEYNWQTRRYEAQEGANKFALRFVNSSSYEMAGRLRLPSGTRTVVQVQLVWNNQRWVELYYRVAVGEASKSRERIAKAMVLVERTFGTRFGIEKVTWSSR